MPLRECRIHVRPRTDWRPDEIGSAPLCEDCIAEQRRRGQDSHLVSVGNPIADDLICRFCRRRG